MKNMEIVGRVVEEIVEEIVDNIDYHGEGLHSMEVELCKLTEDSMSLVLTTKTSLAMSILEYLTSVSKYRVEKVENDHDEKSSSITVMVDLGFFGVKLEDSEDSNEEDASSLKEALAKSIADVLRDIIDDEDEYYDCEEDEECDDYDEDDEYYDYDDYDDYDDEDVEVIYPDTTGNIWCLYVMDPNVKPGAVVANPYVGPDWKVALGNSYSEVLEKYAGAIGMCESMGLGWEILAPSVMELSKMMGMAERFIPNIKAIKEGEAASKKIADYVFQGLGIPESVMDKVLELYKAANKIDHNDNYHAGM